MSATSAKGIAISSQAMLVIAAVAQVAIVLLVTVLLMFALRGRKAPEEDQAKWLVQLTAPKEGEPPPVLDKWDSLDAMLADAPSDSFVEHEVAVDDEVFLLMAPADAKIETPDNNSRIRVTLRPTAAIDFHIGRFDKERRMDFAVRVHGDIYSFPFAGEKALILEHADTDENRYEGEIDATAGPYQLTAHTRNPAGGYGTHNTLSECQLLLKVGGSLKLKEPMPTETIALMERLGYSSSPKTTVPAEVTYVRPRDSCTPAQLELLEKLPNLERIYMHGIGHGPEYFVHFGKCKKLKSLDVSNLWIDDECMEHLARCSELEVFQTQLTDRVTAKGFEAFKQLPNLKSVRLSDVKYEALPGMSGLAAAKGLESLTFTIDGDNAKQLQFTSELDWLGDLPNLKKLNITSMSPYLQDANLTFCSKLPQLEELEIDYYAGGDEGLKHLAAMSSLKKLNMGFREGNTAITSDGIAVLAGLPNLEVLDLDSVPLKDAMLAPLAQSKVSSLELDDCKHLTPDGVLQLKAMPNLKNLHLMRNLLTEEELQKLKEEMPDVRFVSY